MDWKMTLDGTFADLLRKRDLVRLLVFWSAGIVALGLYAGLSNPSHSEAVFSDSVARFARNETGALTAWRASPSSEARGPAYRIAFDNLRAENGSLGVLKTASLKIVCIENLRATFFAGAVELSLLHGLLAPREPAVSNANPLGFLNEMQESVADWSVPVDMANTTDVRIRQLDWRICQGGRSLFRVRCRHATLRSDTPRMVLRGHVTVTTPEAVLESNCVEMDAKAESIVVPGRYSLRCDGATRTGRGARFSTKLKPADGDSSEMQGDPRWENGLQPGSF